jgi:hypothetical protein
MMSIGLGLGLVYHVYKKYFPSKTNPSPGSKLNINPNPESNPNLSFEAEISFVKSVKSWLGILSILCGVRVRG